MQGLMQQQLERMQQSNPELYAKGMQMIQGKSDYQLKQIAKNIAKERGIDLDDFAKQFNIKI